jgi:hypothetical protein
MDWDSSPKSITGPVAGQMVTATRDCASHDGRDSWLSASPASLENEHSCHAPPRRALPSATTPPRCAAATPDWRRAGAPPARPARSAAPYPRLRRSPAHRVRRMPWLPSPPLRAAPGTGARRRTRMASPGLTFGTGGKSHPQSPRPAQPAPPHNPERRPESQDGRTLIRTGQKTGTCLSARPAPAMPAAVADGKAWSGKVCGISHDCRCGTLLLYRPLSAGIRISSYVSDLWS